MAEEEFQITPGTQYQTVGWGIINHVGGLWSPTLFSAPEEAFEYIDAYQRENPRMNLSKHTVVQCRMTIEPIVASAIGRRAVRPAPITAIGGDHG